MLAAVFWQMLIARSSDMPFQGSPELHDAVSPMTINSPRARRTGAVVNL
jgi:hypothetical protein